MNTNIVKESLFEPLIPYIVEINSDMKIVFRLKDIEINWDNVNSDDFTFRLELNLRNEYIDVIVYFRSRELFEYIRNLKMRKYMTISY